MLNNLQESRIDLLSLRAFSHEKYALVMMEALFSDKEISGSCFMSSIRGWTKPSLPEAKTSLIKGILLVLNLLVHIIFVLLLSHVQRITWYIYGSLPACCNMEVSQLVPQ